MCLVLGLYVEGDDAAHLRCQERVDANRLTGLEILPEIDVPAGFPPKSNGSGSEPRFASMRMPVPALESATIDQVMCELGVIGREAAPLGRRRIEGPPQRTGVDVGMNVAGVADLGVGAPAIVGVACSKCSGTMTRTAVRLPDMSCQVCSPLDDTDYDEPLAGSIQTRPGKRAKSRS